MNPVFLNFKKLMRSIVRAICIYWIFYFRDLRSGQFRDLPMLTCARVAVSATFAMVGGPKWPPLNSKTRKARRPGDTAIDSS